MSEPGDGEYVCLECGQVRKESDEPPCHVWTKEQLDEAKKRAKRIGRFWK